MDLIDGIVHPPKLRVFLRQSELAYPVLRLMVRKVAAVGIIRSFKDRFRGEAFVPGAVLRQSFPRVHRHHRRRQRFSADNLVPRQSQRHAHARENLKMRVPFLSLFLVKVFGNDKFAHFDDRAIADDESPALPAVAGKTRPLFDQNLRRFLR